MDIEINVNEQEVCDFQQAQRPFWPNQPTACPVFACGERTYASFASFSRHWSQKHLPTIQQFACVSCKQLFYRKDNFVRHQRKVHNVPEPSKEGINIPNEEYVNPGGILPYKMDFRPKLQEKRRQMCDSGVDLVTTGAGVCRDESFNLRTGSVEYKRKKSC